VVINDVLPLKATCLDAIANRKWFLGWCIHYAAPPYHLTSAPFSFFHLANYSRI